MALPSSEVNRYVYHSGTHHKFWEIERQPDGGYNARWGRIGGRVLGEKHYTVHETIGKVRQKRREGYMLESEYADRHPTPAAPAQPEAGHMETPAQDTIDQQFEMTRSAIQQLCAQLAPAITFQASWRRIIFPWARFFGLVPAVQPGEEILKRFRQMNINPEPDGSIWFVSVPSNRIQPEVIKTVLLTPLDYSVTVAIFLERALRAFMFPGMTTLTFQVRVGKTTKVELASLSAEKWLEKQRDAGLFILDPEQQQDAPQPPEPGEPERDEDSGEDDGADGEDGEGENGGSAVGQGDGGDGGDGAPGQGSDADGGDGGDGGPQGGNGGDGGDGGPDGGEGGNGGDGGGEGHGGKGGNGTKKGSGGKGGDGSGEGDGGKGGDSGPAGGDGGDGGEGGEDGGNGGDGGDGHGQGSNGGNGGDAHAPGAKGGKGGKPGPGGQPGLDGKDGTPADGQGQGQGQGQPGQGGEGGGEEGDEGAPEPGGEGGEGGEGQPGEGQPAQQYQPGAPSKQKQPGEKGTPGGPSQPGQKSEDTSETEVSGPGEDTSEFGTHTGEDTGDKDLDWTKKGVRKGTMPTGFEDKKGFSTGGPAPTTLQPGQMVYDPNTQSYGVIDTVGPKNGKGAPHWVWARWAPSKEEAREGTAPLRPLTAPGGYTVEANPNPGTKDAKKVVEKFTWREANRVKGVSIPALTQKLRRLTDWGTLLYESNKKLDNPSGKTKLYYHEWRDGHPRWVYITADGRWIVALGRCAVKGAGVDDFGLMDSKKGVEYAQAQAVNPWARLATLVGVDVPCAKRDGGTMRFEPGAGWRCDRCNGSAPLYRTGRGTVMYDPETKIIMAVVAVK